MSFPTGGRQRQLIRQHDERKALVRPADDARQRSGGSPDWIKVKNPDAPAAMRLIEG
jgi:hypothetical protein